MRKKTIQEELEEIQQEKEEHIENLNNEYLSSNDDHTYDFKNIEKSDNENEKPDIEKKIEALEKKYNLTEEEKQAVREKAKINFFPTKKSLIGPMIVSIIFIAIGLGLAIGLGISPLIKAANYDPVVATVIHVRTYYDDDNDYMAKITYEYYVNDVRYEKVASYSESAHSSPRVGDHITIYVNPNNPEDVLDNKSGSIFILVFGSIFTLVGLFVLIMSIKEKNKRRK